MSLGPKCCPGTSPRVRSRHLTLIRRVLAALNVAEVAGSELRRQPGPTRLLSASEAARLRAMSPRRAAEFARGRDCARMSLEALGLGCSVVEVGESREPVWPSGVLGSITHTAGYTAAISARGEDFVGKGIGIDAERLGALTSQHVPQVISTSEARWVSRQPSPLAAATLCFSAKEAYFKAQFPTRGEWVEFHDLHVELVGKGKFRIFSTLVAPCERPRPTLAEGAFIIEDGLMVVAAIA